MKFSTEKALEKKIKQTLSSVHCENNYEKCECNSRCACLQKCHSTHGVTRSHTTTRSVSPVTNPCVARSDLLAPGCEYQSITVSQHLWTCLGDHHAFLKSCVKQTYCSFCKIWQGPIRGIDTTDSLCIGWENQARQPEGTRLSGFSKALFLY